MLFGIPIIRSEWMVGAKKAILQGDRLTVSPAMWELISKAETSEELEFILKNLPILQIPVFPVNPFGPLIASPR